MPEDPKEQSLGRIQELAADFDLPQVNPEEFYAELTDPKNHNPKHFCYIVHGANPYAQGDLRNFIKKAGGYDPSEDIDLLRTLDRIWEKKIISCSIINQDHLQMWGDIFFILSVPWDNFINMSPWDRGTNVSRPDFELEYSRPPYTTPLKFIEQSRGGMNEVVVTGKKDESKVKIIGAGIKLIDYGAPEPLKPPEKDLVRFIARRLNVPMVEIVKYSRIEDGPLEVSKGYLNHKTGRPFIRAFYINRGGYRYIFEGEWERTHLKDIYKSDWNLLRGHNPVTREEYEMLHTEIISGISTEEERKFLIQIDKMVGFSERKEK